MGNETSSLDDCSLQPALDFESLRGWSVCPALWKDNSKVTVFSHKKPELEKRGFVENAVKQLKTLRHPSVLKFFTSFTSPDGLHVVTEPVTPLQLKLEAENLYSVEISAGLYNIIEALSFLHERVGVSHNNLNLACIFVSTDGGWKLGGLDYACRHNEATQEQLQACKAFRNEESVAPEEKTGTVVTELQYAHARDAYAFGRLAETLLEYMADLGDLMKTFELRIQDEFLHQDPKQRPHISSLLQDRLFRNEFLDIRMFLKNITLKSDGEKKEFFQTLVEKLLTLPPDLIATRLTELLLSRFVLLDMDAVDHVIPHILSPGGEGLDMDDKTSHKEDSTVCMLPQRLYQKHVIPLLYRVFHVKDAHIRLVLLTHFRKFAHLFDKESLQDVILPQVLLGLRDSNDLIVEKSLEALAVLVPLLGGDTVIGRARTKIFIEGKPRTLKIEDISSGDHIPVPSTVSKVLNLKLETQGDKCNGDVKKNIGDDFESKKLQKFKERERRKEEARKKAEEKRKKREDRRILADKVSGATAMDQDLTLDNKGTVVPIREPGKEDENRSPSEASISAEKAPEEENDETYPYSKQGDSEVDSAPVSENEDNWTDWDEDQAMDAAIEKEIEEEMESMEEDQSLIDIAKETQRTQSPIEPIHLDWSGVELEKVESTSKVPKEAKKGKLKLKSRSVEDEKTKPRGYSKSHESNQSLDYPSTGETETFDVSWETSDWSDTQDIPASQSPRQPKSQSESSKENSTPKKARGGESGKTGHKINADQLGAEFDVLAIEIKASPRVEEFDFFADMAPDISPSASLHLGNKTTLAANNKDGSENQEETAPKPLPVSFAAVEAVADDTETGGWGDDEELEWGDEDKW